MSKHMTIINLACTITKLRKWGEAWKHSAESAQAATARMHQAHETKMAEHRAAFGARTEADRKIIAGLREERDALRAEVEFLKTLRPKHKVGDKLQLYPAIRYTPVTVVGVRTVYDCQADGAEYPVGHSEDELTERYEQTPPEATHAEPDLTQLHAKGKEAWSDVPNATQWVEEMRGNSEATHDTEAGKAAAESALKTEPVADEIKVGDVVEVVSNTGRNTWLADVGSVGTVVTVEEINDSISVHLENIPGKKNALAGYVSFCDVRKVTT